MRTKTALILLAEGCEEMEVVILVDVLRRGGMRVTMAGLEPGEVVASRGVRLLPDMPLDAVTDAKSYDLLLLPGGMPGTERLREDVRVRDLVIAQLADPEKCLGAICAAPLVLDACGVLEGRRFTCYPAVAAQIEHGTRVDAPVVQDGQLLTSQGPGTAMAFGVTLLQVLLGADAARDVAAGLLFDPLSV